MASSPKRDLRSLFIKATTTVLFVLLIASFAVWGIGDVFRFGARDTGVITVGDREIGQAEFARVYRREYSRLQQAFGGRLEPETAEQLGLPQQVVNQLINGAVFEEWAERFGMIQTEEQIAQEIAEQPAFRGLDGRFDPQVFRQVLFANRLSEQQYLEALRGEIEREQITEALAAPVAAPSSLALPLFVYQAEKRVADYVEIATSDVGEIDEPDETSLRSYYDENINTFMAPEYRQATVVRLDPEDLMDEVQISDEAMQEEFEQRREELNEPERRGLRQFVLEDAETAERAEAALMEGKSFDTVAEEFTGAPPVDLGVQSREETLDELAAAAFAVAEGQVTEPVETALGWHILQVTEIQPAREVTFEEAEEGLRSELAEAAAIEATVSIANQLDDELAAGATPSEAADRLDLQKIELAAVDATGRDPDGNRIEDLKTPNLVLPVIFSTEPGEDSLLNETPSGGYFVVHVEGATAPQPRPFESVRDQVLAQWQEERRKTLAQERAEALASRLREGESFESLAEEAGLTIERTPPLTRFESDRSRTPAAALPGELFTMKPGEVTVLSNPQGAVVAQLASIEEADPEAETEQLEQTRENLANTLENDILQQFSQSLRDQYGVTTNERLLDQLVSSSY